MGSFSIYHMLILPVIVVLVFGTRRLPSVMGDFAKGIKAFKAGMKDEDEAVAPPPPQVTPPASTAAAERAAHDRG
jgi:sec-independent protein translocase protein TatA